MFILLVMDMVILDTLLFAMVMDMVLAMPAMGMESVMLRLSPRLMLSMEPMVDMVILDTLLLAMVIDMVLAMPAMGMESVMLRLSLRLMLSMEPMADMVMDLDTEHTPLDMVMVMVLDMDMDMDMDTMVKMNIVQISRDFKDRL